jgi:divalent metal cation (Fe/Co/Zn/Cd) transporter
MLRLMAPVCKIVIWSSSISLVASLVDSAMDFLSTLIIFFTNRVVETTNWRLAYEVKLQF